MTLVELTIAVTIIGSLLMATTITTIGLFTANARVRQVDTLAQSKHDITHELTEQIRWAKNVSIPETNDIITLTTNSNETIQYTIQNGILVKNGTALHSADYEIMSFIAKNYSASERPSWEITIEMRRKNFTPVQEIIKLVITNRQAIFQVTDY